MVHDLLVQPVNRLHARVPRPASAPYAERAIANIVDATKLHVEGSLNIDSASSRKRGIETHTSVRF